MKPAPSIHEGDDTSAHRKASPLLPNFPPNVQAWVERSFSVDIRSLALFRICVGALVVTDVLIRSTDLRAHYTDWGVLPRGIFLTEFANGAHWSFHLMTGTAWGVGLLFALQGALAIGLMLGFRTKLCTVLSWAFMASLHSRNASIGQGGDLLIRTLLFWSIFLPLGAEYSLDRMRGPTRRHPSTKWLSLGVIALLCQVALVYVTGAIEKSGAEWRTTYTAVWNALSVDQFATPIGVWLRQYHTVLSSLTVGVFWWEAIGPFLLFASWAPLRFGAVMGFVGMHCGFYLCMRLGLFPFISICSVTPFLPKEFWDRLEAQPFFTRGKAFARKLSHQFLARLPFQPSPVKLPLVRHNPSEVAVVIAFALVLAWNSVNLHHWPHKVTGAARAVVDLLRLDQRWNMFAPKPTVGDGWYVIPGKLASGAEVDVWHGVRQPAKWEKPALVAYDYPNYRWQKYMMNLNNETHKKYRLHFGKYLCRRWNETHRGKDALETFEINFIREETLKDYQTAAPKKLLLWSHRCFNRAPAAAEVVPPYAPGKHK